MSREEEETGRPSPCGGGSDTSEVFSFDSPTRTRRKPLPPQPHLGEWDWSSENNCTFTPSARPAWGHLIMVPEETIPCPLPHMTTDSISWPGTHTQVSLMAQWVKNPPAVQETQETWVGSLGQEDPLKEEMAAHSGILAWRIPWAEEPGGLQSMGSQRV